MNLKSLALKASKFLNDYSHTTVGSLYAAAVVAWHLKTGRDLGANFVTFSAYFYGFLLGHAGVNQKWPDRDQATPQDTGSSGPTGQTAT